MNHKYKMNPWRRKKKLNEMAFQWKQIGRNRKHKMEVDWKQQH